MAPVIETDHKPASGIELIAKAHRALERDGLTRIRTHDVHLAIFRQTAMLSVSYFRWRRYTPLAVILLSKQTLVRNTLSLDPQTYFSKIEYVIVRP